MIELRFAPITGVQYNRDYVEIVGCVNEYAKTEDVAKLTDLVRKHSLEDLFFLLYFVLRVNVNHPWLVGRIKEVQQLNDRTLDLWAREHYKSSIITYGLNIQSVLNNPEVRVGIFSHTRAIAKSFLRRIKQTFESNEVLQTFFPDIFWPNPQNDSPKWSEDEGIVVRRMAVYQEATIEAWGLVDGMPTGKHFDVLNYDDVVTRESVNTPEQIAKVDECFRLSLNLGAADLLEGTEGIKRVVGTRYHYNDLYENLKKSGQWVVREYPVRDRNTGELALLTEEQDTLKRRDMGPYVYACQMMLDPRKQGNQKFQYEWLEYYREQPSPVAKYMLVDPGHSKKEKGSGSDYTVFWLWGIDTRGNRFWLDGIRKRLSLTEKWTELKKFLSKHRDVGRIGYERYGAQVDVEYLKAKMQEEAFYFSIEELGGSMRKEDRIARLIPWFENRRIFIPYQLIQDDGVDLVQTFINEEYLFFPFSTHDDLLDAASRIEDVDFIVSAPVNVGGLDDDVIDLGWYKSKRESRFANL